MVSGEDTRDIWVFAPEGDGRWPFVFALPGYPGYAKEDLGRFATELAGHGVVVFATDWPAQSPTVASIDKDVECGYRYSLSIAQEHGADLTQPITIVGNSAGATPALNLAIREPKFGPDGSYDRCYEGAPRPDVVVALEGCYAHQGFPTAIVQWGNHDADYLLVHGDADTVCEISQSESAAEILQERDYESVEVIEVPGAGHAELVFWTQAGPNDWEQLSIEHQAGQLTIDIILEAIETAQR
jgi:alpha-beta hydrolase superfamily lysophospholipase